MGDLSVAAWLWTVGGGTVSVGISGWFELLSWRWAIVTGVGVSLVIAGITLRLRPRDRGDDQLPRDSGSVTVRDPTPKNIPDQVERYRSQGEYAAAREWLVNHWQTVKCWPNLVEFLRFVELTGDSHRGLEEHRNLRDQIPGSPPEDLRAAEVYYLARIRGQAGFINDALGMHRENRDQTPPGNLYQLRSWFEIGQLQFRIEQFEESRATFDGLSKQLEKVTGVPPKLIVDILKFRATFEMLHVIFDVPHHNIPLEDWQAGSWRRCRKLSEKAIAKANGCNYGDGQAWGYVVLSFAWEGAGEPGKADEALRRAVSCQSDADVKRNSMIYTQLYRAGFERRRGNRDSAIKALERAENLLIDGNVHHYGSAICEQRGLVARQRHLQDRARRFFRKALEYYAYDPALRYRFEWPKVRRLNALADEYSWEFREFFEDSDH